jgi:cytochrome c-type biogenesis protein CcmH/NrfG
MDFTQVATNYYQQALQMLEQGQADQAEQRLLFVSLLACDEIYANAQVLLGLLYIQRGDITSGVSMFEQIACSSRDKLSAKIPLDRYLARFRPLLQQDQVFRRSYNEALDRAVASNWSDAIRLLCQGLATAGDYEGWLLLSLCYMQSGKKKKARQALHQAKRLHPTDPRVIRYQRSLEDKEQEKGLRRVIGFFRKE